MDGIDMALLRLLVRSPMHQTKLAKSLGITEDEVRQRMRRLQELGLVEHISPEAKRMSEREYKVLIIPCKRCAEDFELRLPMSIYRTMAATYDELFDSPRVLMGTCPDCRKDDPLLRVMDEAGIPTVGRDFSRKLSSNK